MRRVVNALCRFAWFHVDFRVDFRAGFGVGFGLRQLKRQHLVDQRAIVGERRGCRRIGIGIGCYRRLFGDAGLHVG